MSSEKPSLLSPKKVGGRKEKRLSIFFSKLAENAKENITSTTLGDQIIYFDRNPALENSSGKNSDFPEKFICL